MFPSGKEILDEIKKSKIDRKLSNNLLGVINEIIDNNKYGFEFRNYITGNIPTYILSIDSSIMQEMEQGINNPPKYIGSDLPPVVVINMYVNRCIVDWKEKNGGIFSSSE